MDENQELKINLHFCFQDAVVALATEWDLCLSGDALLHVQQHGLERLFVPLVQARPHMLTASSWPELCS